MSFNWRKFYTVGLFLLDYSDEEEYQRSGIGRLYYACFGELRAYYKKAFLIYLFYSKNNILAYN